MTDYSKTIVNTVGLFGLAPPARWGVLNWGAFLWGDGTYDVAVAVSKVVTNSLVGTSTVAKSTSRTIDMGSIAPDSAVLRDFIIQVAAGTIGVVCDMYDEKVQDTAGYYHVFPDRTDSGEARSFTNWTAASDLSVSWASAAVTSTTWSAA